MVRVPFKQGKASGEDQDFLTGFVTEDGKVWGRPVGIAVAKDGSLLVSDDGTGSIWRVSRLSSSDDSGPSKQRTGGLRMLSGVLA